MFSVGVLTVNIYDRGACVASSGVTGYRYRPNRLSSRVCMLRICIYALRMAYTVITVNCVSRKWIMVTEICADNGINFAVFNSRCFSVLLFFTRSVLKQID